MVPAEHSPLQCVHPTGHKTCFSPEPDPHCTVGETEAEGRKKELPRPGHPAGSHETLASVSPSHNLTLTDDPHFTEGTSERLAQGHQPVQGQVHGLARIPRADRPCGIGTLVLPLRAGDLCPVQNGLPREGLLASWKGPGPSSPAAGRSPHSRSWGLRASALVFNKEDEFTGKHSLGGGGSEAADQGSRCPSGGRGAEAPPSGLSAAGGLGCGGSCPGAWRELALCCPGSLPRKPTGYCTAFVCLVTQLLVIEKFHCSAQGRPADPSSRDATIFQKIRD